MGSNKKLFGYYPTDNLWLPIIVDENGKVTLSGIPAHKTSHQNGGSDEISVSDLSGLLGDSQTPLAHKTSHQNGGSDEIDATGLTGIPVLPTGLICMWSGAIIDIPTGWNLCDGGGGRPDLRDKFIIGAGSTYNPADTGGESTHTLTKAEMPAHTHGEKITHSWADSGANIYCNYAGSNKLRPNTYSTGGGNAHENKPPYYALAYIMKD